MKRPLRWLRTTALFLLMAAPVLGCPYCKSDVGKQVAAGLFNQDFGLNALLTLLPIPFFLLIVGFIHFGVPWPRRRRVEERPGTSEAPIDEPGGA